MVYQGVTGPLTGCLHTSWNLAVGLCPVVRDNLHQHALTDWIMLDLSSILHADFKTVFVFALGPLKTKELTFLPLAHFYNVAHNVSSNY